MSNIEAFPKPVLDDLVKGQWLPVIGSGMSLNAHLPGTDKMPLWADLGDKLQEDLGEFLSNSAVDAISAYEHQFSRARLIERLMELLFIRESQPGNVHKSFCSIPFDIVCTTNFDFLLEKQYEQTPRYVYPVIDEEQLSLGVSSAGTILLKLHGDLHHPSRLVATEADYDSFLSKYPLIATYLANLLITRTAIFIGYSLEDPDFRQIWNIVNQRLGRNRRPAYSIMVGASQSEIARFERRGVHVINLKGSKRRYPEILSRAFDELKSYMLPNVIAASEIKEERSLRELRLPENSDTRLCFFSVPTELISIYKEKIFPAVESVGLVPITADEVVAPGNSVVAKIEALIARSFIVVVDPSTAWTLAELRVALASKNEKRKEGQDNISSNIIVVSDKNTQLPVNMNDFKVLLREDRWFEEPENFVQMLLFELRRIYPQNIQSRAAEATRLFEIREYNASVIAAITHLEVALRDRLDKPVWEEARRPLSVRALADRARHEGVIDAESLVKIQSWLKLRNQIVHTSANASRKVSKEIIDGVNNILS